MIKSLRRYSRPLLGVSRGPLLGVSWLLALAWLPASADQLNLQAYKGKVVYLDFWASWCEPCRNSFPWMNSIFQKYKDQGLVIIGVNLDQERPLAEGFIKELNPAFPIVFDSQGELAEAYKVAAMPSALIIDRDGKARFKHIGFHDNKRADYEQELQQLLASPALAQQKVAEENHD